MRLSWKTRLVIALSAVMSGLTACADEQAPSAGGRSWEDQEVSRSARDEHLERRGFARPERHGPSRRDVARGQLDLSFDDDPSAGLGAAPTQFFNRGTANVRTQVVTANGGRAVITAGRRGGFALRFPRYLAPDLPPRAVIQVDNATEVDQLSPLRSPFAFGATVRLSPTSAGAATDNGNNLIQRGLYDDPAQYKIELDHGSAACRVKGTAGEVYVRAPVRIRPNVWHRIVCTRLAKRVTLRVTQFLALPGNVYRVPWVASELGRTGTLATDGGVPLSVGGKLGADGRLETAADQLNGTVDNVFLRIGRGASSRSR